MQSWKTLVQASKYQIYVSRSLDPFLNLSIEHYLLQKSCPKSTILFLYVNRPCVVIGRNQNPWLEVDLNLLRQPRASGLLQQVHGPSSASIWDNVQLVRRRSGGGTVFHDEGNVNYSVICPTDNFTRDKHAEMVTKAIRQVNRHITDMHRTVFRHNDQNNPPLKVSGSAYKLTRQRSLHHGTCLLASTDLPGISKYLQSPSRPFIKARGVESVRSRIGNIYSHPETSTLQFAKSFQMQVMKTFTELYRVKKGDHILSFMALEPNDGEISSDADGEWTAGFVGEALKGVDEVRNGINELKSSSWLYGQTPQFILSSHSDEGDDRERQPLPKILPSSARVYLKVRSAVIESSRISISSDEDCAKAEREMFDLVLKGKTISELESFDDVLNQVQHDTLIEVSSISRWLNTMFGKPNSM
ncbi:hypothetical protein BDR22DRAFT_883207 [Usnea florida]